MIPNNKSMKHTQNYCAAKRPGYGTMALSLLFLIGAGCDNTTDPHFLGSAVIETDTWLVSPSVAGSLTSLDVKEGDSVYKDQKIGGIDSIPLVLKLAELRSSRSEAQEMLAIRKADLATMQIKLDGTKREYKRADSLAAQGAVTTRVKDELNTSFMASEASLQASNAAMRAALRRLELLDAQEQTMLDQVNRCNIFSPATGVVLTRYHNPGEQVSPARPLLKIGRRDTIIADFFIAQPMLPKLKLGMPLQIRIDDGNEEKFLPATLTWFADEAEFTPRSVQTRETRNELVFRARVTAANSTGFMKRGMPVEIWLPHQSASKK